MVILQNVIASNEESEEARDPFTRSISLWMMKEYQKSLDTLLEFRNMTGFTRIFNFYVYLRNHPLLVRQNKAKGTLALSHTERNLYFQTAHAHYAAGCPTLAIHVLTQLPNHFEQQSNNSLPSSPVKSVTDSRIESGVLFDNFESTKANELKDSSKDANGSLDFDWTAPPIKTNRFGDDELKLDWDDDDHEEDEEDETPKKAPLEKKNSVAVGLLSDKEDGEVEEKEEDLNDPHTMISIELKLASCLKLMSEELVSMVGQIEGTELRLHLYAWLEKQVPTLKELCRYRSDDEDGVTDDWSIRDRSLTPQQQSSGLHDILLSEKLDLEWKMGVLSRRSRWLRSNRHLLATLLAFARLHAHSLAPVHIELVFLLDELQREKSR